MLYWFHPSEVQYFPDSTTNLYALLPAELDPFRVFIENVSAIDVFPEVNPMNRRQIKAYHICVPCYNPSTEDWTLQCESHYAGFIQYHSYELEPQTTDEEGESVEPGDEATDAFGGDLKDPLEMNKEVSIDNITNQEDNVDAYKIANVLFDENIKTGEKYRAGVVSLLIFSRRGI